MIRTACVTVLVFCASTAWADDASIARGKSIATDACASCHQVTAQQVLEPPIADPEHQDAVPAPSLYDVAHLHGADAKYLRDAILKPTHPMPARDWSDADLKAVVDYIQSLPR